MEEQDKLEQVYKEYYSQENLLKLKEQDKLSAPFVLNIYESYLEAPVKIMFVGKEVNEWLSLNKMLGNKNLVGDLRQRYKKELDTEPEWKSNKFFKMYVNIRKQLSQNKKGSIIWGNLLKLSYNKYGTYSKNSINHSKHLVDMSIKVFKAELEILKPDFIIFATSTGKGYDAAIKQCFDSTSTDKSLYEKDNLWKFNAEINNKSIVGYRTRHPNASRFKGNHTVAEYYQMIIDDIKKQSR